MYFNLALLEMAAKRPCFKEDVCFLKQSHVARSDPVKRNQNENETRNENETTKMKPGFLEFRFAVAPRRDGATFGRQVRFFSSLSTFGLSEHTQNDSFQGRPSAF